MHPHLKIRLVDSRWLRRLLVAGGWLSLAVGVLGIFLPLVPGIPFLVVAVLCFSRSSRRFHAWLVEHKHLGPMLKQYLADGFVPLRAKCLAVAAIWIFTPVALFTLAEKLWLKVVFLAVAACITVYLLALPTAPRSRRDRSGTPRP